MRRSKRRPWAGGWLVAAACCLCLGLLTVTVIPTVEGAACSPRGRVVAGLDALFGEVHRAATPAGDDTVMEFFSSRSNGTWTLLRTLPDGRSCVVASGHGEWRRDNDPVLETGLEI